MFRMMRVRAISNGLPAAGLLFSGLAVSAGQLDSLVNNSPFAPLQSAAANPAAEVMPLEFRGVFADQGELFFSVFNSATRSSLWVAMNEAGHPFAVRSYDADKQSIVADFQGRSLTLALKKAPITVTMPDPTLPPPPNAVAAPPVSAVAASTDEASRLAAVAAEVRRRRAMRQQAAPNNQPAAPARTP